MKTTRFSIGGYNFDDWSLVKELYVPEDISNSTDKSLHVRGREDWPGSTTQRNAALNHHLQHYVIPYGKVFLAFAVGNVKMSTPQSIGLFGTGKAYGRYPESHQQSGDDYGAPFAWKVDGSYWCGGGGWGTLVIHDGIIYECKQTHTGSADKVPPNNTYWITGSTWDVNWVEGRFYFKNELEMVTVNGIEGAYMCQVDHVASSTNKPCSGVNWDYGDGLGAGIWDPGDEFQADLSSQFGFSEDCLNVSKGTVKPFSHDGIAVFERHVENRLRRIDAMTTGGTMKAGATLYGIEVDA